MWYDIRAREQENYAKLGVVSSLAIFYAEQGKLRETEQIDQRALLGYGCTVGNASVPQQMLTLNILDSIGSLCVEQEKQAKHRRCTQRHHLGCRAALTSQATDAESFSVSASQASNVEQTWPLAVDDVFTTVGGENVKML
jgi:hypothetical protein